LAVKISTTPSESRGAASAAGKTAGGFNIVAFASRNYRLYASGNAVSLIGTWLQRVAMGWLAWQLTHSGAWLGLISFADLFPTVILSPWAGTLADRRDRVSVVLATQLGLMAQALLLAALTWTDIITIESLFALAAIAGIGNAVAQPARLALIPSLVEKSALASAVTINSIIFNGARFVGPATAGIIIATGGVAPAFALNAVTYVAFIAALLRIDLHETRPPGARGKFIAEAIDGYRYAARHHGIGSMLLLMAATALFTRGFVELLPGFADAVFGRGPQGLAWLTAMTGLGAVCGGIWMLRRRGVAGLTQLIVWHTLLMGAALLAFTSTRIYFLALGCVFVAGFALIVTGVGAQTLVQNAVESGMRGRIMAIYGMIFRGGPAIGTLLMGTLSSHFGLRLPVAAGALLCGGVWLWARLGQAKMARELETP
jgi:MFS family permease